MDARSIIILGTMVIAITVHSVVFSEEVSVTALGAADPKTGSYHAVTKEPAAKDNEYAANTFLEAIGAGSNEEVYDALYEGRTLADIARGNGKDPSSVVQLQISELEQQLDERLAHGSLPIEQYHAHKAELAELVTASIYGVRG
jgi:hypothetical protein